MKEFDNFVHKLKIKYKDIEIREIFTFSQDSIIKDNYDGLLKSILKNWEKE